ncbi:nuclear transport factor 2 family protein [Sinorhizobium sp. RAC02]|uniref:nuclear transport factor 2 family protein n=1 Tax=Sinorhizobium sp. RAC02 TaxID=1842534 RepID=UPI00083D7FA4|nr:nuclear transport factor 2 family protein [Sinorhizobium sp. RAC02]AOF89851.1 lumazine-binding family protein [Sinorhizobium sp. RAC02]
MSTAFQDIYALLQDYFDALYFCDVEKLQRVFHPSAIYATADETPLLYRTMAEYVPIVAARQSPASRNEARRDHVDAIDIAGENTAVARVRCSIGARDFVDFLTLVRTDGQWRIIAKVFQILERQIQE